MSYKDVTKEIDSPVLNTIRTITREVSERVSCPVVCAGGAIRDTRWKWRLKDIDIFVVSNDSDDLERASGDWAIINTTDGQEYTGKDKTPQFSVLTCNHREIEIPVQIIRHTFCQSVTELVDGFDYDLVKGYYDPTTDKVMYHTAADKSFAAKTITVDNELTRRRVSRFLQRNGLNKFGWKWDGYTRDPDFVNKINVKRGWHTLEVDIAPQAQMIWNDWINLQEGRPIRVNNVIENNAAELVINDEWLRRPV